MPIYARRRIQKMLDDLSGIVSAKHFIGRLNDKRFENALPAEAELALVWGVSRLGPFQSEPVGFSPKGRRPEGISNSLIPDFETVFDVKALSDRVIPGIVGMRKLSAKLVEAANRIHRGSGQRLEFFFFERSDYRVPKNHRTIYAPADHSVSQFALDRLAAFLKTGPRPGDHIDIVDGEMRVRVTWKPGVSPLFNYRSSIVNEIFDIEDNYIAAGLAEKARQLRAPNFKGLRGVLLADIGSASLRRFDAIDPLRRAVSGRQIVQHVLNRPDAGLDFVCVFSPQIDRPPLQSPHHYWRVSVVVRPDLEISTDGLRHLASLLPAPRFGSYELEHLHEQKVFGSQSRGWYLGCNMTFKATTGPATVRLSARALHEFLAGRIDADRLRQTLLGGTGPFEAQLRQGRTIQEARLVPAGLDEDDDHLELVFATDPAASDFECRDS